MLWKFYLRRMDTALQRSNSETIQGYFTWTMIRTLGKHLSESIREPLTVLEEATAAAHDTKSTDRSKMCDIPRGVTNRLKLDTIPQTVNAYYNPTGNAIEILAGILRPPFFHPEVPEYLNFAGIGSIVAHEMGHGFDNNGRRYDETGAVRDWWTEETAKAFDDKSQCFIEQYNEFTVKGPEGIDHYVNSWRTLGENTATFEAWRQRYRTDSLGNRHSNGRWPGFEAYTLEQVFFIQYARAFCSNITPAEEIHMFNEDNHSPRKFRINGVVQNSEHFSRAFQCKSGTPMNPVKKCVVW